MKKYLLILLIYVCCTRVQGQSITLLNLTNLATLNNKDAAENLTASKTFGLQYGEEVNGFVVEHYQTIAAANKETLIIGAGFKTGSGAVLHTVSYVSSNPQNAINLMAQIKTLGLKLFFHGSDKADNIYLYDNYLYRVAVRLSIDNTKGVVDISQKQVFVE